MISIEAILKGERVVINGEEYRKVLGQYLYKINVEYITDNDILKKVNIELEVD